jgi:hypothetical protein
MANTHAGIHTFLPIAGQLLCTVVENLKNLKMPPKLYIHSPVTYFKQILRGAHADASLVFPDDAVCRPERSLEKGK